MKKIPSLNGLRAISILCVLFSHVLSRDLGIEQAPAGQIGVTIFFVISGFLITLLLLKEEEKNGQISLRNFYIRRAIRIFPVYYLYLAVCGILALFNILSFTRLSWIASLTYSKGFFRSEWETAHFWSLSIEEYFYLVWPVVFKYLGRNRRLFALIIILVVPLVRLTTDVAPLHLFTRADGLMWGCLFALYYESILQFLNRQKKPMLTIPFVVLIGCIGLKTVVKQLHLNISENFILAFFGSYGTLTLLAIAFIIVISINFKNNSWFTILNLPFLNFLGILSYSIYVWQQMFFSTHLGWFSGFPQNLAWIFLVANISYYLVEKPFLKLKDRFAAKKTGNRRLVSATPSAGAI
jgi:peptidoglycan/LPS O-acetylase OafA/YrhL